MEKTMILKFTDDAYFYKFGEQSRINEVLYEIRETINKNFKQYPFVTGISYYLNRNENNYEYVATITYEADDEKPLVEKHRTFKMNVKKRKYYEEYEEVFELLKGSIEEEMNRKIQNYFKDYPEYKIIEKQAEWVEEEDDNVLVVNVTYTTPYYTEEKVKDGQT